METLKSSTLTKDKTIDKTLDKAIDKTIDKTRTLKNITRKWTPQTKVGLQVQENIYPSLKDVLAVEEIKEAQIVDYFLKDISNVVVNISKVSHTLKQGKVYVYRAVVLVGNKEGYIGCGVGKSKTPSVAITKASNNAKKNILYVGFMKKYERSTFFSPITTSSAKKGSTVVSIKPLTGSSVTASKVGLVYCDLCNLKGIKISTGNKGKSCKGAVNSALNYYTALHEALRKQAKIYYNNWSYYNGDQLEK